MVQHAMRPFVPRTTKDYTTYLRGRYYGASKARAVSKRISFATNKRGPGRRPHLEFAFQHNDTQPIIHHGIVTLVQPTGEEVKFHIYVKNHKYLPVNGIVGLWSVPGWKGDILVMRKGQKEEKEFVGMRSDDEDLADAVVDQYVLFLVT
ncbi:hypothetical protein DXG01_014126 [Tephrocybe rancida]|nr:hypothetical protein DXG01_014126 [Tephrocybe rancida]